MTSSDDFDELKRRRLKKESPKTQAGASRDGSGKGPKTTSVGYDQPKFKAGEMLECTVLKDESGGYAIWIKKGATKITGFLPTQALLATGEKITAQFVCWHNWKPLVSARFSANMKRVESKPRPDYIRGLKDGE